MTSNHSKSPTARSGRFGLVFVVASFLSATLPCLAASVVGGSDLLNATSATQLGTWLGRGSTALNQMVAQNSGQAVRERMTCESPKVIKESEHDFGAIFKEYSILSTSPLQLRSVEGGQFNGRGGPSMPASNSIAWDFRNASTFGRPSLDGQIDQIRRSLKNPCSGAGCDVRIRGMEATLSWMECVASMADSEASASAKKSSPTQQDELDIVTPQVPGCPKYLRKSLVVWSRKPGSSPQLNVLVVRNISNKILKVTYRVDGANSDPGTLNPGDSAEVWQLTEQPPYVVRDFNELMAFNRAQSQQKSLQCELAIRPR